MFCVSNIQVDLPASLGFGRTSICITIRTRLTTKSLISISSATGLQRPAQEDKQVKITYSTPIPNILITLIFLCRLSPRLYSCVMGRMSIQISSARFKALCANPILIPTPYVFILASRFCPPRQTSCTDRPTVKLRMRIVDVVIMLNHIVTQTAFLNRSLGNILK